VNDQLIIASFFYKHNLDFSSFAILNFGSLNRGSETDLKQLMFFFSQEDKK